MGLTILNLNNKDARKYFMNPYVYFPMRLPEYIDFSSVLSEADKILTTKKHKRISISDIEYRKLKNYDNVNYKFNISKSGKYSWRPITLFNPIVYVDLVNTFTDKQYWNQIKIRFKYCFPPEENISNITDQEKQEANSIEKHFKCTSIPSASLDTDKNKSDRININKWSNDFEYKTITEFLKYNYCICTDISNCYGSIYTHSIAWALMGRGNAKNDRNKSELGNKLDTKIRDLQYGQTNGIPQSNDICNLIAEIVLGYADRLLYERIKKDNEIKSSCYLIIRYRDDYRIFTKSKLGAELITKDLSNVLSELNMALNSDKTKLVTDLTLGALKSDKLYLMQYGYQISKTKWLPKKLLLVKILSDKYPNSGSVQKILSKIYDELVKISTTSDSLNANAVEISINIMTSILINNPKRSVVCIAILNKLISLIGEKHIESEYIHSILKKMKRISNTSLEEIWLQRISMRIGYEERYNCGICNKINKIHRYIHLISKQLNQYKLELKKYRGTYLESLSEISVNTQENRLHRIIYNTPSNFWNNKNIYNIWNESWMKPKYRKRFNESFINIYKLCHINENIDPKDINPFESYDN